MHYMEENDIINYVLIELKENNITENLDKTNINFDVVYQLFDLLEHLGMVRRKLENNQRFLAWTGFKEVRRRYGIVFRIDPSKFGIESVLAMKLRDSDGYKFKTVTERFLAGFFYTIFTMNKGSDRMAIDAKEYEQLKNDILGRELNSKEVEEQQKNLRTLMQILVYIGMVVKEDLDGEQVDEEKLETEEFKEFLTQLKSKKKDKGYNWVFEHTDVFLNEDYELDEKEYFDKRREEFKIEYKKEPPKAVQTNLDHQM